MMTSEMHSAAETLDPRFAQILQSNKTKDELLGEVREIVALLKTNRLKLGKRALMLKQNHGVLYKETAELAGVSLASIVQYVSAYIAWQTARLGVTAFKGVEPKPEEYSEAQRTAIAKTKERTALIREHGFSPRGPAPMTAGKHSVTFLSAVQKMWTKVKNAPAKKDMAPEVKNELRVKLNEILKWLEAQ